MPLVGGKLGPIGENFSALIAYRPLIFLSRPFYIVKIAALVDVKFDTGYEFPVGFSPSCSSG